MAPSVPPSSGFVSTSSAPSARSISLRSGLAFAGTHSFTGYPRAAPTIAYAMPVFPDVASRIVRPGVNLPEASPSRIIRAAARSFTEPPGFCHSAFAYSSTPPGLRARTGEAARAACGRSCRGPTSWNGCRRLKQEERMKTSRDLIYDRTSPDYINQRMCVKSDYTRAARKWRSRSLPNLNSSSHMQTG